MRKDNDFPSCSCSSSLQNIFLKRSFNCINFISFKHLSRRGIQEDMTVNDFLGSEILKGIGSPTMTQKGLLPKMVVAFEIIVCEKKSYKDNHSDPRFDSPL